MPHRDPETGQFTGQSDMSDVTYADHDIHWIRHGLGYLTSADAGPSYTYQDSRQFEVTERGLDPDELAELRAVQYSISLSADPSANQDQDETGAATAYVGGGFNLTGDEFLMGTAPDQFGSPALIPAEGDEIDAPESGTGTDFESFTRDTDEVGQLVQDQAGFSYPFREAGDSVGGGGTVGFTSGVIDMAGLYGAGPVVDAVDDWSSAITVEIANLVGPFQVEVTWGLAYRVEESESGRTRFGR